MLFSFCSQYYTRFKSYCCEAYNILRKSSNLILNLFHLMAGSNIPDIASDPEKGILKVSFFTFLIQLPRWNIILLSPVLNPFFWRYSSRRSFGWTWTMRPASTSSRILSMRVLVLCFLKWLRLFIGGLNIGADPH